MARSKGKLFESQYEEAMIKLLQQCNWTYTHGDNIHRSLTDPLIEDDLRAFLSAQYKDKSFTEDEMKGIIANLRNVGGQNDYFSLQNTYYLYRDGYDFKYSDGRDVQFHLNYIDFDKPQNLSLIHI